MSLILCLLLSAIVNLVRSSSSSFVHQEEAIFCAGEAAGLMSILRRDFEDAVANATAPESFAMAASALRCQQEVMQFTVAHAGQLKTVQYAFDPRDRSLTRHRDGQASKLAAGLVTDFHACLNWLANDGIIRSFPPGDRNQAGPVALRETGVSRRRRGGNGVPSPVVGDGSDAATPEPPPMVVKAWVQIRFTLTGRGRQGPPVVQSYEIRIFPFRLNRQLTSIWYRPEK